MMIVMIFCPNLECGGRVLEDQPRKKAATIDGRTVVESHSRRCPLCGFAVAWPVAWTVDGRRYESGSK
jgi:hypothetical protein